MRQLIAVAIFCAGLFCIAQAQVPMTGAGLGAPPLSAAFQGPGDIVSSATVFYGLRAYTAALASTNVALINISRASDSHTCDINAASSGGFGLTANCSTGGDNGQSASSFCNSTTCVAVEIYDQIATACGGSPCHVSQSTSAARATLTFNCVGSLPCLSFSRASSQAYWSASHISPSISQPYTYSTVSERTGTTTQFQAVLNMESSSNTTLCGSFYFNGANAMAAYCGTAVEPVSGASANDNTIHAVQQINNDSSASNLYIDGSSSTTTGAGTNAIQTTVNIGEDIHTSPTQFLDGKFWEAGIWPVAFSGGQQSSMNSNQHSYWGF